jgi:FkbM family methyltransferase
MKFERVMGKLRQLFGTHPKHWAEFLRLWRSRYTNGYLPWSPPGARQIVLVPREAYYQSCWFFSETRQGRDELAFFCSKLKAGDRLFDIGSFRGAYALAAVAALDGDIDIHAFEPVADSAEKIREAWDLNRFGQITVINTALGDGTDLAAEFDPESGMMRSPGSTKGAAGMDASFTSLDAYCSETGVTPTIIKLDVEGFELKVLRGATRCLQDSRPRLWLEIHPQFLAAQNAAVEQVLELLRTHRYKVVNFADAEGPFAALSYHVWAESLD